MNPSATGRQCPMTVEQWKPCPAVPCYNWALGPWSACQLHVRILKYRQTTSNYNILCRNWNILIVPHENCFKQCACDPLKLTMIIFTVF